MTHMNIVLSIFFSIVITWDVFYIIYNFGGNIRRSLRERKVRKAWEKYCKDKTFASECAKWKECFAFCIEYSDKKGWNEVIFLR